MASIARGVQADRYNLGRMAFEHILRAGHRRIGVIDHNGNSATDRVAAFFGISGICGVK